MKTNFSASMTEILRWEGGYVDHPKDPGGATNMGITIGTLRDWRRRPVSKADVKALSLGEARDIYRANYADAVRYDDLPSGLDHVALDPAINSGPVRGIRWLQAGLGVAQDGKIGTATLRKAKAMDALPVIARACAARMGFLHGLGTFATFGRGWSRRVASCEAFATALAGGKAATSAQATAADKQAARETQKAAGATAGGAGGVGLTDLPDWAPYAIGAALVVLVIVLIGQRMHQKNRAAAFRAIGG